MKKIILTSLSILLFNTLMISQETIFFEEDFEAHPLTTFFNPDGSEIPSGPSPCALASVGNASDYSSANVDFNEPQNSTNYLGINPESPCGGFYTADVLLNNPIDISSASEQIRFTCRYIITSTLNYGDAELIITIEDGTNTFIIDSEFSETDSWTDLDIDLPAGFDESITTIKIDFTGGEGIAIDDIKIVSGTTLGLDDFSSKIVSLFPNPSKGIYTIDSNERINNISVYSLTGALVHKIEDLNKTTIDLTALNSGIYILKIITDKGEVQNTRVVKQ